MSTALTADVSTLYQRTVDAAQMQVRRLQAERRAEHDFDQWLEIVETAMTQQRHHVTRIFWLHRQERNCQDYARALSQRLGPLFSVDLQSTWQQSPRIQVAWNPSA